MLKSNCSQNYKGYFKQKHLSFMSTLLKDIYSASFYDRFSKISERTFQPNEKASIVRKQSFRITTTRTFYLGVHKLSIIINGQEQRTAEFELITNNKTSII
jgi:hypothetical protein